MAGASLGGGIGFYSSTYGAISDSLASVEVVTGTGALVKASANENSDLFWAIKGAGSSFGAVTSLTYKIHDSPNGGQAMNADMTFPVSQNASLFAFAKSWVGRQPKELSLTFSMLFNQTARQVCKPLSCLSRNVTEKNIVARYLDQRYLYRSTR